MTDFLCEALGYDKYEDLTTEYQIHGEFADYGVRIAKQLVAFIEVKRCTTKLSPRHLRQVEMYAVNEGVEWMILTNGQVLQVWHLTAVLPVVLDIALEVDILGDGGPAQKADVLFYLSKEAFKRRLMCADIQRDDGGVSGGEDVGAEKAPHAGFGGALVFVVAAWWSV